MGFQNVICKMVSILFRPQCVNAFVSLPLCVGKPSKRQFLDISSGYEQYSVCWRVGSEDAWVRILVTPEDKSCMMTKRTFSVLLALCVGNSPVTGEFPAQRPVTWSFDVSLICAWINGLANNREAGDLRRHRNYDVIAMVLSNQNHFPILYQCKIQIIQHFFLQQHGRFWYVFALFCHFLNQNCVAGKLTSTFSQTHSNSMVGYGDFQGMRQCDFQGHGRASGMAECDIVNTPETMGKPRVLLQTTSRGEKWRLVHSFATFENSVAFILMNCHHGVASDIFSARVCVLNESNVENATATMLLQAPVPLSIFRSNSKFDEKSERSSFKYIRPMTTIFCTRHDSDTVVTCAKYRCDRPRIFYTRVFWIFIEFRIRSKYA